MFRVSLFLFEHGRVLKKEDYGTRSARFSTPCVKSLFPKTLPGQLLIIKPRNQPGVALGDAAGVLPGAGFCA